MTDSDFHMWSYWREKYGVLNGALEYYPLFCKENTEAAQAIAMIKNGERILDSLFSDLTELEEEDAS